MQCEYIEESSFLEYWFHRGKYTRRLNIIKIPKKFSYLKFYSYKIIERNK